MTLNTRASARYPGSSSYYCTAVWLSTVGLENNALIHYRDGFVVCESLPRPALLFILLPSNQVRRAGELFIIRR